MTIAQGTRLGPFEVGALIGRGGMGVVYMARDTRLDRFVAIKVLPPERVTDPDRERRFVQEARAASALNHPHIVTIYDISSAADVPFIAMEYVNGRTLADAIGRRGLPMRELLRLAAQIADALAAAHAHGIVHRDLKPGNVIVTPEGMVKVLYFGLAKLVEVVAEDDSTATAVDRLKTMEGQIVGTPSYMSPEQALGRPVDARTDVFAFGSVLYEMVTGRRAFEGPNTYSALAMVVDRDPVPARALRKDVTRDLERIIELCLKKDPARRFQNMADVKLQLETLSQEWDSGLSSPVERSQRRLARWIGIGAAAVVVPAAVAAVFWQNLRAPRPVPEAVLTRLTYDRGLTTDPALSPDGKLLAYASDLAGAGTLDIWVQQVGGGEPVRRTRDAGQNREPSFSPDGTSVVFRSTRDGGGIFLMPAFGGPTRRIAPDGLNPVFSPDGTSVAYYIGSANAAALANARTELWVASTTGAAPREVLTGFSGVCCPIWTPDSGHLLFLGNRDANLPLEESLDWWVVPVGGGPVVKTGALAITRARGLRGQVGVAPFAVTPGVWDPTGRAVIFSARSGDSTNLWQVEVSPGTFQATGEPVRLTSGSAFEWQPSVAALADGGRRVVFASLSENSDIWSFPVAADEARLAGGPRRLTDNAAQDYGTSLSGDGRKLVFLSNRTGFWQVWLKDLEVGEETALTSSAREKFLPVLSPDGSQLTYAESGTWSIYLLRLDGGEEQLIPEAVGLASSFTTDGGILYHDVPGRVSLLDLASRRQTRLLEKPDHRLVDTKLSPDGRWLTFWEESRGRARVLVAPYRGAAQIQEDEWIEVAASGFWDSFAHWSPGSNIIYFHSDRDGSTCLWAQRLDAVTKRPSGAPEALLHEHSAARSIARWFTLGRNRLVVNIIERTGSIWMADWKAP